MIYVYYTTFRQKSQSTFEFLTECWDISLSVTRSPSYPTSNYLAPYSFKQIIHFWIGYPFASAVLSEYSIHIDFVPSTNNNVFIHMRFNLVDIIYFIGFIFVTCVHPNFLSCINILAKGTPFAN